MSRLFIVIFCCILLLFFSDFSEAAGVIGRDRYFAFPSAKIFITSNPQMQPYCDTFNFFFSIQIFFGLYALFLRILIRVFRM